MPRKRAFQTMTPSITGTPRLPQNDAATESPQPGKPHNRAKTAEHRPEITRNRFRRPVRNRRLARPMSGCQYPAYDHQRGPENGFIETHCIGLFGRKSPPRVTNTPVTRARLIISWRMIQRCMSVSLKQPPPPKWLLRTARSDWNVDDRKPPVRCPQGQTHDENHRNRSRQASPNNRINQTTSDGCTSGGLCGSAMAT